MIKPQRILVIRLGGIGDILFTLPAINMLKNNFPESELTFLTKSNFASLLKGFNAVDNIIDLDSKIYHNGNIKKIFGTTFDLFKKVRNEHYELIVDFHGLEKTALITGLTGAKNRWGIVRKNLSKKFYTVNQPIPEDLHRIDLNLSLLE